MEWLTLLSNILLLQLQHSSRKVSVTGNELEPVHKPLHRYRRFHRTRRHSKVNEFEEVTDKNRNNDSVALPKKNGKHCIQKKIDRLVEENRILTMKLENSAINPGKFSLFFLHKHIHYKL